MLALSDYFARMQALRLPLLAYPRALKHNGHIEEVLMNKLDIKARARILACLVEGNSIRATVPMTGAAKNTVVKLLAEIGAACAEFQDKTLRNLPCKNLQCDEIWSFVYAKARNASPEMKAAGEAGDVWT